MKKLDQITNTVCAILVRVGSIILIGIMFFVFINVILRLTIRHPILGSTEMVRYAALIGAAFALAQNEWFDGNIRVTMVLEMLPKRAANAIAFIGYAVITCGIGMISYLLFQQAQKYFQTGNLTTELSLPSGIFAGALSLGFLVLMIVFAIRTIIFAYRLFAKDPDLSIGTHKAPME